MRAAWHDLWGSARGPVRRLAPRTRLLCAAAAFAACMVAPVQRATGLAAAALAAGSFVAACRPPAALLRRTAALALVLFAPYALLAPWLDPAPGPLGRLTVPWTLLARGAAGLAVTLAATASLTASDLRDALLGLPVPRVAREIVLQIVHQTGTLGAEARRIASAMAVRGATGRGAAAFLALAALPRAWIPRVVDRAERVAIAMELRGYCEVDLPPSAPRAGSGGADALALAAAAGALALAAAARLLP